MMVCMDEWAHHASIWVAPQKLKLLSLFGTKAFFNFCTSSCWRICQEEHMGYWKERKDIGRELYQLYI